MKSTQCRNVFRRLAALALGLMLSNTVSAADVNFTVGVRPQQSNWTVSNTDTKEHTTAGTTQAGLDLQLRVNSFYAALSSSAGIYRFDSPGPERADGVTPPSTTPKVDITRTELDLVLGYYILRNVSLFIDLKSIANKWEDDGYQTSYAGIGYGVSGNIRFNEHWGIFGSAGLMPMKISDDSGDIGEGRGRSLEAGALLAINQNNVFTLGLKSQAHGARIDANNDGINELKQWHQVNGLVFRYYYTF